MSTITNLLMSALSESDINELSNKVGGSADSTKKALGLAVPMLMGLLGKQTAQGGGLSGIMAMLDLNKDGNTLDDIMGFIQGGSHDSHNSMIGNLLGGNRAQVESQIGQQAGLDTSAVSKLLPLLVPMIMSAIKSNFSGEGISKENLSGLVSKESSQAPSQLSGLMAMFDKDGDGNVIDDVAKMGAGLLGDIFKK